MMGNYFMSTMIFKSWKKSWKKSSKKSIKVYQLNQHKQIIKIFKINSIDEFKKNIISKNPNQIVEIKILRTFLGNKILKINIKNNNDIIIESFFVFFK